MQFNFSNLLKPGTEQVKPPFIINTPVVNAAYSAGQIVGSTKVSVVPAGQVKMSSMTFNSDTGKTSVYASENPRTVYVNTVPVLEIPTNRQQFNYIRDSRVNLIGNTGNAFHDFISGLFSRNQQNITKPVPSSKPLARQVVLPPAVTPKVVYVAPAVNSTAGKIAGAVSKVPGLSSFYRGGAVTAQSILQRNKKQNYNNKKSVKKRQRNKKRKR